MNGPIRNGVPARQYDWTPAPKGAKREPWLGLVHPQHTNFGRLA